MVVIAIIAVLAAILFPVFAKAREKSRQSTCLNNQRQIVAATQIYLQDNDELFPSANAYWQSLKLPSQVTNCPTEDAPVGTNTYGYAVALAGTALGTVTAPSSTAVTADWNTASTNAPNQLTMPSDLSYRHDPTKYIVSFVDGHVDMTNGVVPFSYVPAGYNIWLDASQASSVLNTSSTSAANGDQVGTWNTSHGTPSNPFVPPTRWTAPGNGPIFRTNIINGLPALKFTRVLMNALESGSATTGVFLCKTLVVVAQYNTIDGNDQYMIGGSRGWPMLLRNGKFCFNFGVVNPASGGVSYCDGSGTPYYAGTGDTKPHIFVMTTYGIGTNSQNAALVNSYCSLDGGPAIQTTAADGCWLATLGFCGNGWIGYTASTGVPFFDGYIAEVIAYTSTTLSVDESGGLVRVLKAKYAIP